jgi:thiamine biosynthesis lipoprotein
VAEGPAAADALSAADIRLDELESRWSRFRSDSEVSRLNDCSGQPVEVSPDTVGLVAAALSAWRTTGGWFDPTVLPALVAAGYDRSFELLGTPALASPLIPATGLRGDPATVLVDAHRCTVTLPRGTQFDPGGLGKGLAADLAALTALDAGATAVLVSLGGDVRAMGSPSAGSWVVGIEDPHDPDQDLVGVAIADGAVATSGTHRRRWVDPDGRPAHHLIDPRSGQPSTSDLVAVTVIAAEAVDAEVLAKVALLAGTTGTDLLLADSAVAALTVRYDGTTRTFGDWERCVTTSMSCSPTREVAS